MMLTKNPELDERNKRVLEFINSDRNSKILVIGTGVFPKIEFFLFNRGYQNIISTDIDEKNLKNGKKILPKLKFEKIDAEKRFDFRDGEFDSVILTEVLEHINNEIGCLKEINRVLKNNGRLVLSVPKSRWFNFFSPITWIQHKREYDEEGIGKSLRKAGFKIKRMFVGGNIYDLFNLWLHLIYKYFFHILHIDPFFRERIEKSYKKGFKGKGTDIIVEAEKYQNETE